MQWNSTNGWKFKAYKSTKETEKAKEDQVLLQRLLRRIEVILT